MALLHLPEGAPPTAVVRQPGATTVALRASAYPQGIDRQSKPIPQRTVGWSQARSGAADVPSLFDGELPDRYFVDQGYLDPEATALVTGVNGAVALSGGRTVDAFELVPAAGAGSRFYAVVRAADGTPTAMAGGEPIDPLRPLPARVTLPGGDGWVVAQPGGDLAYRVGPAAQWEALDADLAVVPAAGQVRVRMAGAPDEVVDLG